MRGHSISDTLLPFSHPSSTYFLHFIFLICLIMVSPWAIDIKNVIAENLGCALCNAHCAFCIYALCIAHHLLFILTPILSLINPVQMLRFKIICLCSKTCNFIFLAVINHLTWEMLWLQYHEVMINPLGQPDCKLGVFDFDSFPYACGPLDSNSQGRA